MSKAKVTEFSSSGNKKIRFWSSHIENFEKSSQNRRTYCKEHGLSYHAFFYWRKKLKLMRTESISSNDSGFVQLPSHFIGFPSCQSLGSGSSISSTMRISFREFSIDLDNQFSPSALRELMQVLIQL